MLTSECAPWFSHFKAYEQTNDIARNSLCLRLIWLTLLVKSSFVVNDMQARGAAFLFGHRLSPQWQARRHFFSSPLAYSERKRSWAPIAALSIALAYGIHCEAARSEEEGSANNIPRGLYVWGYNHRGNVPYSRHADVNVPVRVKFFDDKVCIYLACGRWSEYLPVVSDTNICPALSGCLVRRVFGQFTSVNGSRPASMV